MDTGNIKGCVWCHGAYVTTEFVLKQLQSMPENKTVRLDKLSGKLLRGAAPIIAQPLAFILSRSLQSGNFISEWKHAKVLPLHKTGPQMERNNCRPISILPIFSKILERFVHSNFSQILDKHNLITITQSGFRKLHSTVTSLLNVIDKWLRNIDNGLVTGVVFIDLIKAFNTVDMNILLSKLSLLVYLELNYNGLGITLQADPSYI